MNDGETVVCVLMLFFIALIGGGFLGHGCTDSQLRQEAIKAGVAEWQCDPQTGAKYYHWKTSKEMQKVETK